MGAPDLMMFLRGAGFELKAVGDGSVRMWPADALTDELRALIREHKAEVLEQLAREALEERAGIRAFDGGQGRADAERAAAVNLGVRAACLTCANRSRYRTCLQPVEAGITTRFEIVFCESLPVGECPAFEENAP